MKTTSILLFFTSAILSGLSPGRTVPNHASADRVIGQADFTGSQSGAASTSLFYPKGIAVDPTTGKLFVADSENHRILRYASAESLANGAAAEAVLGQDGFTNEPATSTTSQSMNDPSGLFVDHLGRLWVADRNNARVLRFSSASTLPSHSAADRVYGQQAFTTKAFAVTATGMINPTGVWVDSDDRLWVADEASCRVLRFDNISSKDSGAAADGVLGQPDMTSGSQGSGATGLERPMAIVISQTGSLFVACERAHRVVRFDQAATLADGAEASAVFGQATFGGDSSGLSATKLNTPTGLAIAKDDTLWIGDQNNNRILRIDKASTRGNGVSASGVVGQADFITGDLETSRQGFYGPQGAMVVDSKGRLWVADTYNNRVLRFPAIASKPVLTVTSQVPKTTGNSSITIKGTASDPNGIAQVLYSLDGASLKEAAGGTKWKFTQKLKKGENRIDISAKDPWGDLSRKKVITVTRR